MVIATTMGNLAATSISYVSSMSTITAQRAEIDRMWAKVHNLSNSLASNGRQFAYSYGIPISKVYDIIQNIKNFFHEKQSQYHESIIKDKLFKSR